MPSWVTNIIVVKGESEDLYRFYEKYFIDGEFDFNNIVPEPETEEECPDCYNLKLNPNDRIGPNADGKDWFNWYDWREVYWGCKWNVGIVNCFDSPYGKSIDEYESNRLEIRFKTPWSHPEGIIDKILEDNPHLDIGVYSLNETTNNYEEFDSNETKYVIETPLNGFEKFDRKYNFVKRGDWVLIYGADEGIYDWAIPALEKCKSIVTDGDEYERMDCDDELDYGSFDVILSSYALYGQSDLDWVEEHCYGRVNLFASIADSQLAETLEEYFTEAIYDNDYFLGLRYRGPPEVVLDEWCVCLGCGRKVNKIAVEVHKKCPFCEATSFRPLD